MFALFSRRFFFQYISHSVLLGPGQHLVPISFFLLIILYPSKTKLIVSSKLGATTTTTTLLQLIYYLETLDNWLKAKYLNEEIGRPDDGDDDDDVFSFFLSKT